MTPQKILQDAVSKMLPKVEGVQWTVEANKLAGLQKRLRVDVVASIEVDLNDTNDLEMQVLDKVHQITSSGQVRLEIERLHD